MKFVLGIRECLYCYAPRQSQAGDSGTGTIRGRGGSKNDSGCRTSPSPTGSASIAPPAIPRHSLTANHNSIGSPPIRHYDWMAETRWSVDQHPVSPNTQSTCCTIMRSTIQFPLETQGKSTITHRECTTVYHRFCHLLHVTNLFTIRPQPHQPDQASPSAPHQTSPSGHPVSHPRW